MNRVLSKKELFSANIIGVKLEKQTRSYTQTIGPDKVKEINRTRYLKICCMCGSPFESYRINTIACTPRCSQNIWNIRKMGLNPPARLEILTKEKNVKGILEEYEYR